MTRLLILVAATTLTACTDRPAPTDTNESASTDAPAAVPAPAAPGATGPVATPPFAETPGAHPSAPEPAPIPAKFRGTWAETKADCANLQHPSRLGISGRTVRTPNAVLFGDSFTFPAPNQCALKGKFEGSGQAGAAHYSIDAAGDVLTDQAGGGAVRVRCG